MKNPTHSIVLIGGYGYTATLIAHQLDACDIPFTIAGSDRVKLAHQAQQFEQIQGSIQVNLRVAESFKTLLDNFDIFINCAGPFTEESRKFVEELSKRTNKVYLDISGELGFVKDSLERNHEIAVQNKTTLIHACAFESFLADLGAQALQTNVEAISSINTYYQFAHSKPSPGTRLTMKLNKFRSQEGYFNANWRSIDEQSDRKEFRTKDEKLIAIPYPLPEVAIFSHYLHPKNTLSYLLLASEEALFVGTKKPVSGTASEELEKLKNRKTLGPNAEERSQQKWKLLVEIVLESQEVQRIELEGTDMYGITASCMLETIKRVLSEDAIPAGVLRPSQLLNDKPIETLKGLGISCTFK